MNHPRLLASASLSVMILAGSAAAQSAAPPESPGQATLWVRSVGSRF